MKRGGGGGIFPMNGQEEKEQLYLGGIGASRNEGGGANLTVLI